MSGFKNLTKSFKKKPKRRSWFFGSRKKKSDNTVPVQEATQKTVINTRQTKKKVDQILSQAQHQAQDIVLSARDKALDIQDNSEVQATRTETRLFERQTAIDNQKSLLAQDQARIQTREQYLHNQKKVVTGLSEHISKLATEYLASVQDVANTTETEVSQEILETLHKRLELDKALTIQAAEDKVVEETDTLIQEMLINTLPSGGIDYGNEYKSPVVRVTSKRILNEIRGTNNCNQEFLEKLAKVELVIDEEGVIRINAPDSVDRELTRQVLEKLVKMGRVNPATIRRVYQQTAARLDKVMYKAGKDLCYSVGVFKLPKEIMQKLGKFKYRFSFGQNMIEHTLEETLIGISLAHEFKADSNIVRLGCLFHDIGKVIYDDEGTHVETGVAFLKEHNIPQAVIDCVAQSHEDEPFSSIESLIVHIADGISGARPAARLNDHEFANRVKYLEEVPLEYKGVKDAYAIQAGREVRVLVDPRKITDDEIKTLAKDLRDRIKSELTYPGSVTVNVIREVMSTASLSPAEQVKN